MTDSQLEQMIAIADVIALNVRTEVATAPTVEVSAPAPKATVKKSAPKQTTSAPVVAKSPKVLKVDKYGNQWVAEYNAEVYAAKKAEMIGAGTYDSKNRSAVYKALGWIL